MNKDQFGHDNLVYEHDGNTYGLPLRLVIGQQVSKEEIEQIIVIHKQRHDLKKFLETVDDVELIGIIFNQLTRMEFDLQILWNFKPDSVYHRSWDWPKCTCPKLDNMDAFPFMQYYSGGCPLHKNVLPNGE